jgi:predicted DsbA family dithiol-disulfide isomerase
MDIAEKSGLDSEDLHKELQAQRYLPRLQKVSHDAQQYGITGAPTFIINDAYTIVGAQPLEVFRDALKKL